MTGACEATMSSTILVAGAVTSDYLIFQSPASISSMSSSAFSPSASAGEKESEADKMHMVIRKGGADLVAQLLAASSQEHNIIVHGPNEIQQNGFHGQEDLPHSLTNITQREVGSIYNNQSLIDTKYIAKTQTWHSPEAKHVSTAAGGTLVLIDSGNEFTNIEAALDLLQRARPSRIVYYMTRPLASGKLWDALRNGPNPEAGVPEPDSLAVIVDAEDLRSQGINLSYGLSWEATSEDFVRNLGSNGRLDTLVTCPNLIVRFGNEGVIHHRGRDAVDPKLYFSPSHNEGSSPSSAKAALGTSSAFTAGFSLGFSRSAEDAVELAIQHALAATREYAETGLLPNPTDFAPDFPLDSKMLSAEKVRRLPSTSIPSSRISTGDRWLLLDNMTGDPAEVARQILTSGPEKALGRCPTRQYGDLVSIERTEIESIGAICSIVDERFQNAHFAPTCIGIFGSPGSGKKFTAASIATHLGANQKTVVNSYDARFLKEEGLATVCHAVRDASATGSLPVVLFENFETVMNSEDEMVDTFSTLMSDGTFPDRGSVRNLGHAVLFFLINQETNDGENPFTPTPTELTLKRRSTIQSLSEMKQLRLEDSPLMDLLHGVIRVAGPNCVNSGDKMFPIRRALMLRHIIKQKYPHLEINGVINVDDAVLHALLLTPSFKHGLGSVQKIISSSRLSNRSKFDVSALPPEEQIQLHVDGRIFMSFLRAPKLKPQLREVLAQGLFVAYRKQRLLMAKSEEERRSIEKEPSFRDWEELSGELKESTRSQADDIPRKLRSIGCFMLEDVQGKPRGDPLVQVLEFGKKELLMLSEMEHERFNAERLQKQWRMGPRNAKQRSTPFLVPWRDLTQEWKDVDTVMVECVPAILQKAGWRIYRMKD